MCFPTFQQKTNHHPPPHPPSNSLRNKQFLLVGARGTLTGQIERSIGLGEKNPMNSTWSLHALDLPSERRTTCGSSNIKPGKAKQLEYNAFFFLSILEQALMEYWYHQVVLKETDRYNLIEIPIYTYIYIYMHTKGLCSKIMFLLEYWVFSKTPFASQNTLCTFPARTVMFEQSFPRKTNCDSFYKKYISPESTNKNRSTWVRRGGSLFGNAYQWQGGSYELFMIFRFLHSNPPNCTWRPFKGHCHGGLLCIPDATNGAGSGDTNVLGSVSYGARFRFYVKKAAVKKSKE